MGFAKLGPLIGAPTGGLEAVGVVAGVVSVWMKQQRLP
jgi:hypothetical protein